MLIILPQRQGAHFETALPLSLPGHCESRYTFGNDYKKPKLSLYSSHYS